MEVKASSSRKKFGNSLRNSVDVQEEDNFAAQEVIYFIIIL
jgi:hypothetical protein